ncbi:phosphoribosyl-AMP cyclohydrolase [Neisseriaceae bacterium PsAf]|nr:phosphoribosyl-AMP cyclohydrolase [Neisseriaceae bacterium PsAf]
MNKTTLNTLLSGIHWDDNGLIPVIAQDTKTKKVLMLAWMNKEALIKTCETKQVHYFSRSRNQLWLKGESSGHYQNLKNIYLDCDADVLLVEIEQIGGISCHTGRESCFFKRWDGEQWQVSEPVLKNPQDIYNGINSHE